MTDRLKNNLKYKGNGEWQQFKIDQLTKTLTSQKL